MNIFKIFVQSAPVKTPLTFGYNENVVIEAVDFSTRTRNGIAVKANTFIKLSKLDKDGKVEANTEINFWNLDHTKDFAKDNFMTQFSVLAGIIAAVGGDIDSYETAVMEVLGDSDDVFIANFLKKADNAKNVQQAMIDAFKAQITSRTGLKSTRLKCKMISNKAGYMEAAADIGWILPMDSEAALPLITSREKAVRKKALETSTKKVSADKTGAAPEKAVVAPSLASI
jgi:hypothetical protein